MLTLEEYISQHGTGHEAELTDEMRASATTLLERVNTLLADFGQERGQRSGWRPQSVNDAIPTAAHGSRHITCEAVDVNDDDQALQEWCQENDGARLVTYDLFMEDKIATPTWTHLQSVPPGSGLRVFYPTAQWAQRAREQRLA
jgi:hypothetical protein